MNHTGVKRRIESPGRDYYKAIGYGPQVIFMDSMVFDISSFESLGTRWPGVRVSSGPLKSVFIQACTVALEPTITLSMSLFQFRP